MFELSLTTQTLYQLFMDSLAGNRQVSWSEIKKATDGKERNEVYGSLQTVIKNICRDHKVVFDSVRRVGYRALTDNELAEIGQRAIDRARRSGRRARKKMNVADLAKLGATERMRHVARLTIVEMLGEIASPYAVKKVDAMVKRTDNMTGEDQLKLIKEVWSQRLH